MPTPIVVAWIPRHDARSLALDRPVARCALSARSGALSIVVERTIRIVWPTTPGAALGSAPDPGAPIAQALFQVPHEPPAVVGRGGAKDVVLDEAERTVAFGCEGDDRRFELALPPTRPHVFVVSSNRRVPDADVEPFCVRVSVDLAEGRVIESFRGDKTVDFSRLSDVDMVAVAFATEAEHPLTEEPHFRWMVPRRDLPRAAFERATFEADLDEGRAPEPLEDDELAMARYSTWGHELAPLPTMTTARHASIAVELADQRRPRDAILADHGLTDYEWTVEEMAFAAMMGELPDASPAGEDGEDDEPSFAERYARDYDDAQRRRQDPGEARRGVDDYARVLVAMEEGDPRKALADHGIGLGAWIRLEQRMSARAAAEPAFAEELERAVAAARAPTSPEARS